MFSFLLFFTFFYKYIDKLCKTRYYIVTEGEQNGGSKMKKYQVLKHHKEMTNRFKMNHHEGIAIDSDPMPEIEAEFDTLSKAEEYFKRCDAYIDQGGYAHNCYGVIEYSLCIMDGDDFEFWAMKTI